MSRQTRRIIFLIFVLIFIIIVPAIILYAEGYSFDLEKRTIVSSGGIYLKSYPPKADIYINNKPEGKTSKFVRRLIPKVYNVKIIKEEYHPWEKNISVKSGLVTRIDNIFLVPFNPKILLVATESDSYSSFFKSPYSLDKLTEIIKKKSKYTIFKIENINIDKSGKKIYFLSNNNLYSVTWDENNPENSTLSQILVPNVLNYAIYKNGIIYLDYFTGKIFELDVSSLKSAEFFDQVFPSFNQGKWILSDDNKKLLCQKDKSVEILWLGDEVDVLATHKKGDIEKIDFGQIISEVIWYPKTDQNLIISTRDSILVTELNNQPPRNTIKFITTETPQIKYDADNRILYFFSQKRLYQTEL
ncbi:MAG: PEGA domain-containing protein [Patescibacteria group bacterium]